MEQRLNKIQQELEQIRLTYPVCGITVFAPDDSLTDDVCSLCDARHVSYNRIDAVRQADGLHKKNTIDLNPFYIPLQMDEAAKDQLILKKAVIFSDMFLIRILFNEEKAVSVAERYADIITHTTIIISEIVSLSINLLLMTSCFVSDLL